LVYLIDYNRKLCSNGGGGGTRCLHQGPQQNQHLIRPPTPGIVPPRSTPAKVKPPHSLRTLRPVPGAFGPVSGGATGQRFECYLRIRTEPRTHESPSCSALRSMADSSAPVKASGYPRTNSPSIGITPPSPSPTGRSRETRQPWRNPRPSQAAEARPIRLDPDCPGIQDRCTNIGDGLFIIALAKVSGAEGLCTRRTSCTKIDDLAQE
jgi:hypothetical protein